MAIATNLSEGAVVKTVNIEGKEISKVEGNQFLVTKWGERKDKDGNSLGVFEASSSRQILTDENISAISAAVESVDDISLREICLVFNQVQREDAINACNSEIRGSTTADPEAKKFKGLARSIEAFIESGDADMVKALITGAKKGGKLDVLQKVLGDEKYNAALNM